MKALNINQDISIIRDYSSGSNARTILCMDEKGTFYRKYAFGKDGEKLFQQIRWIENNKRQVALPKIIRYSRTEEICFYDMAYNNYSIGMFEYAHSMPVERTWNILLNVMKLLEESIYQCEKRWADLGGIHAYYEEKVKKNIDFILDCEILKGLRKFEELEINGKNFKNLSHYRSFLSEDALRSIIQSDPYSVIHGDLTLENIICMRGDSGEDCFYLIDPNTGNLHESKYLDYAKLLQSLHGEYEFIKSAETISVCKNRVKFSYTKSLNYKALYALYKTYLRNKFDDQAIKSIYYHEIIHWLRLIPYQIKNNSDRAVVFYGRLLVLLDELSNKYGDRI